MCEVLGLTRRQEAGLKLKKVSCVAYADLEIDVCVAVSQIWARLQFGGLQRLFSCAIQTSAFVLCAGW